MFSTLLIGLVAFAPLASAGEEMLRYDNSTGVGDAFLPFGSAGHVLLQDECTVTVFQPSEGTYPVRPVGLQVLLGGADGELLAKLKMWTSVEVIRASSIDGVETTMIDQEDYLFRDVEAGGTMFDVDLIEDGHIKDVLIEEGTIAFGLCAKNDQFTPAVMMDLNAFEGQEDTGLGYMSGDRHLVLLGGGGGPWMSVYNYMYDPPTRMHPDYGDLTIPAAPWEAEDGSLIYPGDFVMRLIVETNATPSDGIEIDGNAELFTIVPILQEEGASIPVLIRGDGIETGTVATIGTYDVHSVAINTSDECEFGACCRYDLPCMDTDVIGCDAVEGFHYIGVSCMSEVLFEFEECVTSDEVGHCAGNLNAKTNGEMPAGVYDVTITTPSGAIATLEDAFTVEEKKGCGCTTGAGMAGVWWLGLAAALGWRRRR